MDIIRSRELQHQSMQASSKSVNNMVMLNHNAWHACQRWRLMADGMRCCICISYDQISTEREMHRASGVAACMHCALDAMEMPLDAMGMPLDLAHQATEVLDHYGLLRPRRIVKCFVWMLKRSNFWLCVPRRRSLWMYLKQSIYSYIRSRITLDATSHSCHVIPQGLVDQFWRDAYELHNQVENCGI